MTSDPAKLLPVSVWGPGGTTLTITPGGCAIIRLCRPRKRNALSLKVTLGLFKALAACEEAGPHGTGKVRVVFLCAEGKAFCAGGDASALSLQSGTAPEHPAITPEVAEALKNKPQAFGFSRLLFRLTNLPQPTVALVGKDTKTKKKKTTLLVYYVTSILVRYFFTMSRSDIHVYNVSFLSLNTVTKFVCLLDILSVLTPSLPFLFFCDPRYKEQLLGVV